MENKNKPTKILSIEAKDIYNSNHLIYDNPIGYSIREKTGGINIKLFKNTLDYSLDLIKLREIYEKVFRRHDFTFSNGRHDYTQHVINVKFEYSHKEYNKAGKDKYILNGYQWRDIELDDHICVKDGLLIAIETNLDVKMPCDSSVLGNYFEFSDGKYKTNGNFKTLKNKSELREYLYENGFVCDKIKYVRWKRSSGSSRVGKCLFINELLYKRMHKWETCGLNLNEGCEIDLAALEAYISLTSSSIIDTMELKPENFLVINDYESVFLDKVIGVKYEHGQLMAKEQEFEIKNSIFDGETLLDENCWPEKYNQYSMILLRQRMFKSACFKTKIQKWFKDNSVTDVSQLNGFTIAKDIKDIKVITTPSSIKYIKFGSLKKWLAMLEPTFGIVKHEKPTHYFNGRKVSCHYQLLNTLQLTEQNISELLSQSFDYISKIRNDPDILKFHINYPYNNSEITSLSSKNEIIFKLLGINANFAKTKLYYDFRNDLIRSLLRDLKQGHILINGNYSTLLGNGYEMLQHSIGIFKEKSILGKGNIHSKKFDYNKTILGSRSPHICSGNILLATNVASEEIDKYFELSNEVVYINAIGENIQQRLNGCDYDSDSILLTDNPMFIDAAQKNYYKFKVPTCFVSAKKIRRYYTSLQKADLDVKTSVNKIGEVVNLSQYLNSIYWQKVHDGCSFDDNKQLYGDICKLAVLSNIEIDKAKKEYEIDINKEINIIKEKYKIIENVKLKNGNDTKKTVKPIFFKMITLENGYELNNNHLYKYFDTPMDYIQKCIKQFTFRKRRKQTDTVIPFSQIVKPVVVPNGSGYYYLQKDRIVTLIRDANKCLKKLYLDFDKKTKEEKKEIYNQCLEIKQECIEYINKMSICKATMYLLLTAIDKHQNKDVRRFIFSTLFRTPNKTFFTMIKNNIGEMSKLEEDINGDILLYDIPYKKIKICESL